MPEAPVRVIEVQFTREFDGSDPVWTDATVIAVTPEAESITFPVLGSTTYAVRRREIDVFGQASDWSEHAEHTTAEGPDANHIQNATATVIINEDGITILDGSLILEDEFGRTVMVASGFSGSWDAYLKLGLYNAQFLQGTTGALPMGRTASLPYWEVAQEVGSPTAEKLANGGVEVKFDALEDILTLTSDPVPVRAGASYVIPATAGFVLGGGSPLIIVNFFVTWYDATDTPIGLPVAGTPVVFSTDTPLDAYATAPLLAPGDAATAVVTVAVEEFGSPFTHHADNAVTIGSAGLQEAPPEDLTGHELIVTSLTTLDGAVINGDLFISDGGSFSMTHSSGVGGGLNVGDTTFPTSGFGAGTLFYRSDLQEWFRYDGTRWQCLHPHQFVFPQVDNLAASSTDVLRVPAPFIGSGYSDIWLENLIVSGFFVSGGTALSGSHRWSYNARSLNTSSALTALATFDINSGASNAWRQGSVVPINALLGSAKVLLSLSIVKTGTPGNLYIYGSVTWRHVAT